MATLDITRSIDVNAPAEKVWAALTGPDHDLTEMAGGTWLTLLETGFEDLHDLRCAHDTNTGGWRAELGELVEFLESR